MKELNHQMRFVVKSVNFQDNNTVIAFEPQLKDDFDGGFAERNYGSFHPESYIQQPLKVPGYVDIEPGDSIGVLVYKIT